jgi:hypothetical protein
MSLFKPKGSESRPLARIVLVIAFLVIFSAGTYLSMTPDNNRCRNAVEAVRKIDQDNSKVKELAQKDWESYKSDGGKSEGMTRIYSGFNEFFNTYYASTESYRNSLNLKYLVITGDKQCFSPLLVARAESQLKINK